uniref:Uncharacterized protein n=1 Tax=Zea mays TaxID=4577 RepID=A0A804LP88_MAIZE
MRYEALLLRDAKYCNDLHLQVSCQEWLTFATDCLDNGFYTIASKAFANALVHIHPSHLGHLDSANSIEEKDKIIEITGLQNLAKSLSAQHCGVQIDRKRRSGSSRGADRSPDSEEIAWFNEVITYDLWARSLLMPHARRPSPESAIVACDTLLVAFIDVYRFHYFFLQDFTISSFVVGWCGLLSSR